MKYRPTLLICLVPFMVFGQSLDIQRQQRIHPEANESLRAFQRDIMGNLIVLSTQAKFQPDSSYIRWYDLEFTEIREVRFDIQHPRFEPVDFIYFTSGEIFIVGSDYENPNDPDYGILILGVDGSRKHYQTFGGNGIDSPKGIVELVDSSLYIFGQSTSGISGIKTETSRGGYDFWVLQTNKAGELISQKTLGGDRDDYLSNMIVNPDGSKLIWGESLSKKSFDKITEPKGMADGWMIVTDSLWNSVYQGSTGGEGNDRISSDALHQKDCTIFLCGEDPMHATDKMDIVLVGMDPEGITSTLKHLKANDIDMPGNMLRTCDGGYLLCANTRSDKGDDKSEDGYGGMDIWVVRMDKNFNVLWDKTIGGSLTESYPLIHRVNQRDYILTFSSQSPVSGNLTQNNPKHHLGLYVIHFSDEIIPKNWFARLWKGCHFCGSVKRVSKLDTRKFRQDHTINFIE